MDDPLRSQTVTRGCVETSMSFMRIVTGDSSYPFYNYDWYTSTYYSSGGRIRLEASIISLGELFENESYSSTGERVNINTKVSHWPSQQDR